jgi:acetyl-CoA/propionyl-CoA carboxylase carboxyl transferase subunit
MNARALGATRVFAWPGAEIAVMGCGRAIRILHRRRLSDIDPDVRPQSRPSWRPSTSAAEGWGRP